MYSVPSGTSDFTVTTANFERKQSRWLVRYLFNGVFQLQNLLIVKWDIMTTCMVNNRRAHLQDTTQTLTGSDGVTKAQDSTPN
jgi:hypothetical protein